MLILLFVLNLHCFLLRNPTAGALLRSMPPKSKLIVEYAKSGRSSCRKCSTAITSGAPRLGLVAPRLARHWRDFNRTKWHHFQCLPPSSAAGTLPHSIKGFSSLKSDDQEELKKRIESLEEVSKSAEETWLDGTMSPSKIKDAYKDATLPPQWQAFETVIYLEKVDGLLDSQKIAAFNFGGCLAKKETGADAWSFMYPTIPEKLNGLHKDGYKLVIFTNDANIELWKNKRQVAVDKQTERLVNFMEKLNLPIQIFIACGSSHAQPEDAYRKPKTGMWHLMERHFNSGLKIDMENSFYVGNAAGIPEGYSAADIKFAETLGLKFHLPEEYFSNSDG